MRRLMAAGLVVTIGCATTLSLAWDGNMPTSPRAVTTPHALPADTLPALAFAQDEPPVRRPDRRRDGELAEEGDREGGPRRLAPGGPSGPGGPGAGPTGEGTGPDFRRRRPVELTDEQIQERLEILQEIHPELAERMENLRDENPERVSRALNEQAFWLGRFVELKRTDPVLYELTVENVKLDRASRDLARRYRRAHEAGDDNQVRAIRGEMAAVLEQHFDVRQKMRQHELQVIEQRLQTMRKSLAERLESRDQLIAQRLEQLTGESRERIEW